MTEYDPDVEEIDVQPYEGEPDFDSAQADIHNAQDFPGENPPKELLPDSEDLEKGEPIGDDLSEPQLHVHEDEEAGDA